MKINQFGFAAMIILSVSQLSLHAQKYSAKPVPFNQISIHDSFWTPRLEAHAHHTLETTVQGQNLTFIPYFSWDNREPGKMKVWIDYQE